ncbi:MAG: hypothetical protein C5B47_07185 [Verrucomicrobia bacterium]|nr:MAG: hypothetical protein C5B47_07185 [Verrucomicrobiota bacterium]
MKINRCDAVLPDFFEMKSQRMKRRFPACSGFLLLMILMSSCASVSVQSARQTKNHFYLPAVIYVQSYHFDPEGLAVDRSGKELREFQKVLATQFEQDLQKNIQKKLVKSEILPVGAELPRGPYWFITGHFNHVRQGSRMLRALCGFGLGKTKMNITTFVYALSGGTPRLLSVIKTTGTSGAMPGALPTALLGPAGWMGGVASGALESGTTGLSFDTRRTAREITAVLSQYFYQHGGLSKKECLRVKRAGHWF